MRPALLRLLKRPSAVSFLGELLSASSGIEQLRYSDKCIPCQLRLSHGGKVDKGVWPPANNSSGMQNRDTSANRPLPIHDITRPEDRPSSYSQRDLFSPISGAESRWNLDVDTLEFESDVGHLRDIGSRLVDNPQRRHDFTLWAELLRYRQRHFGEGGVIDIWEGLTQRVDEVDVPAEGELADLFWQSFVRVGLKREQFLNDLVNYASDYWHRTGKRWAKFHRSVVGGYFDRGFPLQAVHWHRELQAIHLRHPNDIVEVLDNALACEPLEMPDLFLPSQDALKARSRLGLQAFKDICRSTEGHKIYSFVIPALLKKDRHVDAVLMHDFLIKRQDPPSNLEEIQPLLEYSQRGHPVFSKKLADDLKRIRKDLVELQDTLAATVEGADQHQIESGAMTTIDEGNNGIESFEEIPLRDGFGARLFATKALTVDMIVGGFQVFGVQAIGPLSLREMALRANGPQDILEKIRALRKAGIAIRESTFTRLVEKLALDHRDIILQDLLHSDQHPDVLEDVDMQENFLCSYYVARDWRLYNLTLAILGELLKEPELHNIHFRKFINTEEWSAASRTVDDLHRQGRVLSNRSIEFMIKRVLTPRIHGRVSHPVHRNHPVNEEAFVTQILQKVAISEGHVNSELWLEVLKRLGMSSVSRWEELRDLCLWLTQHYVVNDDSSLLQSLARSRSVDIDTLLAANRQTLRHIFNPQMQMAIVAWGFKLRLSSQEKMYRVPGAGGHDFVPWVRGLVLLRELQQRGVEISQGRVRRACRQRLAVLYGRPRHSNRRWNRLLRRENHYEATRVIDDMIKVWGPSLFNGQEKYDLHELVNPPSSALSMRKTKLQRQWVANFRARP